MSYCVELFIHMFFIQLVFSTLIIHAFAEEYPNFEHLSEELIRYINNKASTTWTAGRSNPEIKRENEISKLKSDISYSVGGVPESFDSREKWPNCTTIGKAREQAECGSCWAFAAVEVLSDRFCILTEGRLQPSLSAQDVLTCNQKAADCHGGHELLAWVHMEAEGVVTGGSFEDQSGCKPYSFKQCSHNSMDPAEMCHEEPPPPTPECIKQCRPGYPRNYEEDKFYADIKLFISSSVEEIQHQIMESGPVQASMLAYKDFFVYKSGIYQHVAGSRVYGHSVKIIGWGVENDLPYWLAVNSWNPTWGENGLFRIIRGRNECGLENQMVAGFPKLTGSIIQPSRFLMLTPLLLLILY